MKSGTLKALHIILFSLAAVLILVGIFRGEALDVFRKAIRICLECIGLG